MSGQICSELYNQRTYDSMLMKCADYVRQVAGRLNNASLM